MNLQNGEYLEIGRVGIGGTDYIPSIPIKEDVEKEINEILTTIECVTNRAIDYMLYGMRGQLFWDGNKRTSTIIANKIMIENGKGIITIKEEYINEFNKLLTDFYNTNNKEKIEKFIYNKCIYGLEINS